MNKQKKIFHVFFKELASPHKRHWRKVHGIDEKQALWESKWIAIAKDWIVEEVKEFKTNQKCKEIPKVKLPAITDKPKSVIKYDYARR